jgi:membrane protein GlpM
MRLFLRALFGAGVVVVIQLFSRARSYYIAGLVPLFPTFTLISHYIVGTEHPTDELKATIAFGMFSLIPYSIYLVTLYLLVDRMRLVPALAVATVCWFIAAAMLVFFGGKVT